MLLTSVLETHDMRFQRVPLKRTCNLDLCECYSSSVGDVFSLAPLHVMGSVLVANGENRVLICLLLRRVYNLKQWLFQKLHQNVQLYDLLQMLL
jgi:hypothetical protein